MRKHVWRDWEWWELTCRFAGGEVAKQAFDELDEKGKAVSGRLQLGVYRHGPPDGEQDWLTAVSHVFLPGMEVASHVFADHGGVQADLDPRIVEMLIQRRAEVLAGWMASGRSEGGSMVIRRKRGARIGPGGWQEQIGGDE